MPCQNGSVHVARGRAGAAPHRRDDGGSVPSFAVQYADDDPYLFWDGIRMCFGRDADACQIAIWEKIHDRALSKVAGELWCTAGQMWVRNLSMAHEVVVGGGAAAFVLPARWGEDPGNACSVPAPRGTVSAPSTGTWQLLVSGVGASTAGDGVTLRVDNIPERLRQAAEALCAPMLNGGTSPATYAQIALDRGWTERAARRRVEELCSHYEAQIQALPGGRRHDETLTSAVARALVERNKFAVPRQPQTRSGSGSTS